MSSISCKLLYFHAHGEKILKQYCTWRSCCIHKNNVVDAEVVACTKEALASFRTGFKKTALLFIGPLKLSERPTEYSCMNFHTWQHSFQPGKNMFLWWRKTANQVHFKEQAVLFIQLLLQVLHTSLLRRIWQQTNLHIYAYIFSWTSILHKMQFASSVDKCKNASEPTPAVFYCYHFFSHHALFVHSTSSSQ